ncbi:MAG TPA: replicative DNA helicase [Verrucomicrobiae bacterium]|nr:replicative DNA helicase [Verrucomicrobiae bacterium]
MASTNPLASDTAGASGGSGAGRSQGSGKAAALGKSRSASALVVDRVLPNSLDAEMAVLGAMLLSPAEAGSEVREHLSEQHFYYAAHQVIFREIAALQDAMQAIDLVTLTQRLQDKNQLEEVGGPAYLSELVARVPTTANVEYYIEIVWEKHLLRQLISAAHDVIVRSFEQQDDVKTWVDEVEKQIFEITAEKSATGARPVRDMIKDAMASIEKLYDQRGGVTGVPTGFRDFDRMTSGLHAAQMIVIAARPSMGKTALAMNIAENCAIDHGLPVGIFSLEMSSEELIKRMLCSRARVNLRSIRDGFLGEQHFHPLTTAASLLMKAPLYIDDSAGLSIHQVRARARRMKQQYNIQLLIIDYMQLMRAPSRRADLSRQVEIADISAGIKALSKELKLPIIVLSQLNRQPEQREDGRPKLADLRESGAIEQDADVVGLLVRPEMYATDTDDKADKKGDATLFIAKQRNGPTGDIHLTFRSEFTRFEDQARVSDEDVPDVEGGEE